MISSSGEDVWDSLDTQRATRETLLSCLTVSCFNVITWPALVHEAFSGSDPTNIHLAARVTPQSSAQTCAESHLKSCAYQHLTDVCVAVFGVSAAPPSAQMTDLSETKVRLLVHENTPAGMLNLHLYKFGASGWDVLFQFPGLHRPRNRKNVRYVECHKECGPRAANASCLGDSHVNPC